MLRIFGSGNQGFSCGPAGLGGKTVQVPLSYPIDLQYVAQQVEMILRGRGFRVTPMVGSNMAVIQATHSSILGMLTDQNKAYTVRICQGQGFAIVETGIANLMSELITAGATFGLDDLLLHNKLLTMLGVGVDAYGMYKDYAGEEQLLQQVEQIVVSAPPMGQYGGQQGYGQPMNPQGYGQPMVQPQRCPRCGTLLQQGMRFCGNCGYQVL